MWQQVLKIRSEGLDVTLLIKLDGETNYGRGYHLWQQSLVGGGGGGGGHCGTADSPAGPLAAQTNYGVAVHFNVKLVTY